MHWIYLSPHFDDAAYSCGGLIWEQAHSGDRIEIWTLCAGDPPPGPLSLYAEAIHQRWQTGTQAVAARRQEDEAACRILGGESRRFSLPDCIYRRLPSGEPLIFKDDDLFTPLRPEETGLVEWLSGKLGRSLPPEAALVAPLSLGGHMDHRLARAAAERQTNPLYFYADFPYVVMQPVDLSAWIHASWYEMLRTISRPGLAAWQDAVAAYVSQSSTFWPSDAAMRDQMRAYWESTGGKGRLWMAARP